MDYIKVRNLNLGLTIESGQIFRYELIHGWYYVTLGDRIICLRQEGDKLYYYGTKGVDKRFIIRFFRLDDDYEKIMSIIGKDDKIRKVIWELKGLRIIRQNPWECLISFLCSSASNIPKIKLNAWSLSKFFGRRIILGDYVSYSFPLQLDDIERISAAKTGFRAKYIHKTAQIVDNTFFQKLRLLPYTAAKKELMRLPGVGSKIADCVLLYSLDFLEAFPVDVWVKRAVQSLYFKNKNVNNKKIEEFARSYFGSYAGYAQQFLFHHRRTTEAPRVAKSQGLKAGDEAHPSRGIL